MSILNTLQRFMTTIGHVVTSIIGQLGFAIRFLGVLLISSKQVVTRPTLISREIYFSGVLSLLIIVVSGLFVGMVLGLQTYGMLTRFGSANALGGIVAISLLRELGPVLSAILFAGRAGSAITAEIGLMKATEQLDAMRAMAVNPIARIIAPRFWAGVIAVPLLASIFNVMGIFGSYLIGVSMIGLDDGIFWSQMQANVDWDGDIANGLIKSLLFGFVIMLIAVFKGYDAQPTANGVANATTRTVVISALAVLALDFILTALMF